MSMRRIHEPLLPDAHRAVSISEAYYVDSDGRFEFHTVHQELEVPKTATTPLIGFAQYVEHGAVRDIQVSGCLVGDMQPIVAGHPLHIIDFVLDNPLPPGERTAVEYTTWFAPGLMPPMQNCRRRVGSNALDHLKFAVHFGDWRPDDVWQAEWDPTLPANSSPFLNAVKGIGLTPGEPDTGVLIAQREDRNLAAGSVVGIGWR